MPFYRHVHHRNDDGNFIEWHKEGYLIARLQEFDEIKAPQEPLWQIDRRKKLFAEIELPPELAKAGAELSKAWADLEKAWADLEKAWADLEKAWAEWDRALAQWDRVLPAYGLARLHREVCLPDCPWDGKTIFPEEEPWRT